VLNRSPWRAAVATGGWAALAWLAVSSLGGDQIVGLRSLDWLAGWVLVGALLGAGGLGRGVRATAFLTTLMVILVGFVPPFGRAAIRLIRIDSLPAEPVDAVLVLSAAVSSDERLSPAGADRLLEGLRLTRAGHARRLVLSRVWTESGPEPISSDRDQRALIQLIDSTVTTFVLDSVGTTRLEAVRLKALADAQGWRRIIVVTSPVHTKRSCAVVERVGLAVVCRPSPDRATAVWSQRSPTDRLRAFGQWAYETLGWWKYRLKGWV
jgi:uncharacterized SAM-binding protein YcdF (DUF218 family)